MGRAVRELELSSVKAMPGRLEPLSVIAGLRGGQSGQCVRHLSVDGAGRIARRQTLTRGRQASDARQPNALALPLSAGERDQLIVQLRRNLDAIGALRSRQRFAALAGQAHSWLRRLIAAISVSIRSSYTPRPEARLDR